MLTVYNFAPAWDLPTPSPFGLKLETWLRMAGVPYECEYVQRPVDSPKGTVPYIRDGDCVLADTGFILEYLNARHGWPLGRLSDVACARAHVIRRMLEENTARIIGYTRWLTDENWPATREVGFGKMQEPWKSDISAKARKRIGEDMHLHGIARHTPAEVQHIGTLDLEALENVIGRKPFVLGDQPSDVDATAFGIVVQFIVPPLVCAMSDYARRSPVLCHYVGHILERWFPEYPRAVEIARKGIAA